MNIVGVGKQGVGACWVFGRFVGVHGRVVEASGRVVLFVEG